MVVNALRRPRDTLELDRLIISAQHCCYMDSAENVVQRLYQRQRPPNVVGNLQNISGLTQLIENTVTLRRGDSCLFIGPRGSGKTLIIESVIDAVQSKYPDQLLVVRLDGNLHYDDKIVFREIARQIDRATTDQSEAESIEKLSLNGTIWAILQLFRKAEIEAGDNIKRISVLFVVDDVDRFMAQSKQTLLYNILDLTKNSTMGVSVICTSSKINVQQGFEKRVRSRFGLLTFFTTRPSREEWMQLVKTHLETDDAVWNSAINSALTNSTLRTIVDAAYMATKDLRQLNCILAPWLQENAARVLEGNFFEMDGADLLNIPSTTEARLIGLCELDWALLICAARAQLKFNVELINFNMADSEYRQMAKKLHLDRARGHNTGYRIWPSEAARLSWERLQNLFLLSLPPASHETHRDLQTYRLETNLDELRLLLPQVHTLHQWTRL